ncbi:MAG: XTP/dITP diphosphatase [Desulfobulbaceae bacterium]|nr:MAG: XTP/dITP diphosphatase [Desulfobulbaceae bacterium]
MFDLLVLATTNKNKIKEFKTIFTDFPVEIKSLSDFGPLPEAVEDGKTFDDNAYKKAHHYAKVLGIPCIADDSGLSVDALDGAPGVYSARYAGKHATDVENCQKLISEMTGKTNRGAHFTCVVSIATPSGPALTYEATCDGLITEEKRGDSGFGYDPVFYYPSLDKTFAELSLTEKNSVSHRGKVMKEIQSEIPKIMQWVKTRMMEELPEQPDHSEFEHNDWSQ